SLSIAACAGRTAPQSEIRFWENPKLRRKMLKHAGDAGLSDFPNLGKNQILPISDLDSSRQA
ncbi:MAG: hypothetical protein IJQ34_09945, partial [Kiritimatiellae bacterium]|nr:hypothetical protein [Kiritimatiellia bacterium]